MDEGSRAKRPRVDESDGDEAPYLPVRGDPWLEDGNVVLVAQGGAFRVLQSILSKNSDVFRDMFTVPQPTHSEMFEGCPVVHLQDTKHDLEMVLKALFDRSSYALSVLLAEYLHNMVTPYLHFRYIGQRRAVPFTTVLAWLRLGTKYQIDQLRQDAILRLEECFQPTDLGRFQEAMAGIGSNKNDAIEDIAFGYAIAVLALAKECDVKQLLQPAFYWCAARLSNFLLVEGILDDPNVQWRLASRDLRKCMGGQYLLRTEMVQVHRILIEMTPSHSCKHAFKCRRIARDEDKEWRDCPLPDLPDALAIPEWIALTCTKCKELLVDRFQREAEELWDNGLGVYFGLG